MGHSFFSDYTLNVNRLDYFIGWGNGLATLLGQVLGFLVVRISATCGWFVCYKHMTKAVGIHLNVTESLCMNLGSGNDTNPCVRLRIPTHS